MEQLEQKEVASDFPAGRFEHKYLVPDRVAVAIRDALLPHLDVDEHTPAGHVRGYAVYSIYLDNPSLDLYKHTRQRVGNRFKLRVRFYDHEPDSVAFVEVKEKFAGQIFKRRYQANKQLVESMLRDPRCEAVVHALGNGARGSAFEEFCRRREDLGAAPKVFVAYDREAYNSKSEPRVRVTFDRRITTNPCGSGGGMSFPRYGSNVGGLNVLLEFKYAGEPPTWLTEVITYFRLRRNSFSKFAECIDVLGISGQAPRRHRMGMKDEAMNLGSWLDTLLYSDQGSVAQPITLVFTLLLAFAIGQVVGWMYLATNTSADYARPFVGSLVVLPVIVSLLMMLMAGSLMVAFGLLAVFAVVRFRNVLRDTRDTVFVLWSIVEGMAVGTGRYSTAVIGTVGVGIVLSYLRISNFGSQRLPDGQLCVEISGDPAAGRAMLDRLLYRHANRWELTSDRAMPGQGLVLTYLLHLRDRARSGDLREELATSDHLHEVSYVPQPISPKKDAQY